jgi:hypothetical protein
MVILPVVKIDVVTRAVVIIAAYPTAFPVASLRSTTKPMKRPDLQALVAEVAIF